MEFANINTNPLLIEYLPILIFIVLAVGIITLAIVSSLIIVPQNPYKDKISPYECGFDSFEDTKKNFDVRFYLVAILFIIFDLEIVFMYPWALSIQKLNNYGFYSMFIFMLIITIGFIYEWKKGALEWD